MTPANLFLYMFFSSELTEQFLLNMSKQNIYMSKVIDGNCYRQALDTTDKQGIP